MSTSQLPIPDFFDPERVSLVWRIPYEGAHVRHGNGQVSTGFSPSPQILTKTWLMLIDVQNTFCIPDFELYVGWAQRAAVEDNARLCEFIYRNLKITQICPPWIHT